MTTGTTTETAEKIYKLIIEHLECDPEKVTPDARFIEDLGADSLDEVELAMACEEEFDIELRDEVLPEMKTVGDLVKFVEQGLSSR